MGFYDLWDLMVDLVDVSHFTDIRFVLFAVSNFLLYSWYHVPYMFLAAKAGEMGLSEDESSNIISYLGIFNTVGEVSTEMGCCHSFIKGRLIDVGLCTT
jgi:hypothetical protein